MIIGILGYGVVGRGVYKIALKNNIEVKKILEKNKVDVDIVVDSIDDIVNDLEIDTVVECMGGDDVPFNFCAKVLKSGKNLVTSNKKMLVKYLKELNDLAIENNVSLLYSSACGGTIPVLHEINRVADIDKIVSISGIMNGTSNYILDQMYTNDLDFDIALKQAQELGYAEKDPSDDIDGVDSANKLILASLLSFDKAYKLDDLFIKGIRHIKKEDMEFFKNNGYRCILLGKNNNDCLTVMPTLIKSGPYFNISLNNNCFMIEGEDLGKVYLIGQGAGSLPTASNVVRDLKDISNSFNRSINKFELPDYDNEKGTYYIRGKGFVYGVSINELKKMIKDDDFICEVLDD